MSQSKFDFNVFNSASKQLYRAQNIMACMQPDAMKEPNDVRKQKYARIVASDSENRDIRQCIFLRLLF